MKLTKIQYKIGYSIRSSIHLKCSYKTFNSATFNVRWKIDNEIRTPNGESFQRIKRRMLNNLQDEIN